MDITPDVKDWTWVLRRGCPECGLDVTGAARSELPLIVRENGAGWADVLAHPRSRLRPRPDVWSPLEYACHVRDLLGVFEGRLDLVLAQDDPVFPSWDQDAAAVAERYAEQDPAQVGQDVYAAAESFAARLDGVHDDQWDRQGTRADGTVFSVDGIARYVVHEMVHHRHDVRG